MTSQDDVSAGAPELEYWRSSNTRAWADHHQLVDRLFSGLTQVLLDAARPLPGERVIDIGCGSGTTVLELASRVGSGGHVVGADIAEQSLARARERITASGMAQAEVVLADASAHAFAPQSFNLAFSRFGVMFFADPVAAFTNVRNALKPGGRLALAVFRTPQENPWSTAPLAAVRGLVPAVASPGLEDPGQFSWADPARVRRILEGAGFGSVSLAAHDPAMRLAGPGGAADAADFAMIFGPVTRRMVSQPASQRDAVRAALEAFFRTHDSEQGIVMPGAIWIVTARA
jgi:SAM-dependent methyltransferase